MRITFYGSCGEVSGSNFLVETDSKRILFECGIFQGSKLQDKRNFEPFGYDPRSLDAVVVCHAHLDHTGRLPKLVKEGYIGPIYATFPTKELTGLVLADFEKLAYEDYLAGGEKPLFGKEDIAKTLDLFKEIALGQPLKIADNLELTFKKSGHILGSSCAILDVSGEKLAYTSDLGNNPTLLLDPPDTVSDAKWIVCESTYGGRIHENLKLRQEKLNALITKTIVQKGVLLIPAFAIERTQELLYDIDHFCDFGNCASLSIYLDSPLAWKVTELFKKYPQYLRKDLDASDRDFLGLKRLKVVSSVSQSKAIDLSPNPKIIVAGSGMMNGGRIIFHARKYLGDPANTLLLVSYQAQGTLGRKLFDGEKTVKILGGEVEVKAKIETIGSYSSHADLPQLLSWVEKNRECKEVFVVHGEKEQAAILEKEIREKLHVATVLPILGKSYII